jgi:hypothetical protein
MAVLGGSYLEHFGDPLVLGGVLFSSTGHPYLVKSGVVQWCGRSKPMINDTYVTGTVHTY